MPPPPMRALSTDMTDTVMSPATHMPGKMKTPDVVRPMRALGNFSAGPAGLSDEVMLRAQAEFCNKDGTGMGILEMSHRDAGGPVQNAMSGAVDNLRSLLKIPSNYHVLFMQGGAHGQFAAVPLNLLGDKTQADYVTTGYWGERAAGEASRFCTIRQAYDGKSDGYARIPPVSEWDISPDSAYVHICANETLHGLEFLDDPELPAGSPPLVGDFTSTLMSRPVNVSRYGVIYASGGKNLGPAGVTVVIVRDDLLGREAASCPSVLSYAQMARSRPIPSVYNTPPTFLIYMVGLVLAENAAMGGVEALERRAERRASSVYGIIEQSGGFYQLKCHDRAHRSRMNIPFRIGNGAPEKELEEAFCKESAAQGMLQLFCHPLFPGCRVTLYNGLPDRAVNALEAFMVQFARKHSRFQ